MIGEMPPAIHAQPNAPTQEVGSINQRFGSLPTIFNADRVNDFADCKRIHEEERRVNTGPFIAMIAMNPKWVRAGKFRTQLRGGLPVLPNSCDKFVENSVLTYSIGLSSTPIDPPVSGAFVVDRNGDRQVHNPVARKPLVAGRKYCFLQDVTLKKTIGIIAPTGTWAIPFVIGRNGVVKRSAGRC